MPATDTPFHQRLQFRIIVLFVLILVVPLGLLHRLLSTQLTEASRLDRDRRLGYVSHLLRERLDDQVESLRIKAKTLADFELYEIARGTWTASPVAQLLEREGAKAGLDIAGVAGPANGFVTQSGALPAGMAERLLPTIRRFPLSCSVFVYRNELWIIAAAEVTKIREGGPWHLVLGQQIQREFCDRVRRLTGAEVSLVQGGIRRITTMMDVQSRRLTGTAVDSRTTGVETMEIAGAPYFVVREEALPGRISEPLTCEVALPQADFTDLTRTFAGYFSVFGGLGIALALLTGSVLSLSIVRPLGLLAEWTTRVARGDFRPEPLPNRNDEIGQLHRNFVQMVADLDSERQLKETRMRELKTLFEISNAVNFLTDSEELLKFILTRAVEILKAERGSIMLLDDRTDELMVKVAIGGRYRLLSSTPVKFGQGICGIVARDGQGRIANEGFKNPDFKSFGSLVPVEDIRNLLCSPLKFKEGTIGVLNVVNRRDGGLFDENDLSLLNLIASQAAVTIENNKLYELSITDGLTHLMVHRYFQARLAEELLRARRYGLKLSLIMIDIDNFKRFNDTYGHQVGDIVLQRVAQTVRDTIRAGIDIPCRYGGEELAVILPETRAEEAFKTAERIRENIALVVIPHALGDLQVTCSLGVSAYPSGAHDQESLVAAADRALYQSKHAGKNRSTLWEPENSAPL